MTVRMSLLTAEVKMMTVYMMVSMSFSSLEHLVCDTEEFRGFIKKWVRVLKSVLVNNLMVKS